RPDQGRDHPGWGEHPGRLRRERALRAPGRRGGCRGRPARPAAAGTGVCRRRTDAWSSGVHDGGHARIPRREGRGPAVLARAAGADDRTAPHGQRQDPQVRDPGHAPMTAYLVAGARTPFGRYGGALAAVRPDDLAAHAVGALTRRLPSVDWGAVDDVVLGCANQAGEDNRNVARMAVLLAGLPVE